MGKLKKELRNNPEIISLIMFILGAAAVIYITNNFLVMFAPFIIAYIFTVMLRPSIEKFNRQTHIPMAISTIIYLILCISISFFVIMGGCYFILEGCSYFIDLISANNLTDKVLYFINNMDTHLTSISRFLPIEINVNDITSVITDFSKTVVAWVSKISFGIAMNIPNFLISFIIGCVAAAYMLFDYKRISGAINRQLSDKTKKIVEIFHKDVLTSLMKMMGSYVIISGICFIEILIGFKILGIEDAVFIALLIAIFDVLPVVGSGGILAPWGIISLLMGNKTVGIGLLVLWGVIIVVRQISEPKIVGSQVGLHPLITVAALYSGLKLMGGLGLIVAPVYVLLCKKMNEEGLIRFYKTKEMMEEEINDETEIIEPIKEEVKEEKIESTKTNEVEINKESNETTNVEKTENKEDKNSIKKKNKNKKKKKK